MTLNDKQLRALKKQAHHIKPVVLTGAQGLTESVMAEIDLALEHHELIKVRLSAGEKSERQAWGKKIASELNCQVVQEIGYIVALFRRNKKKPKIKIA